MGGLVDFSSEGYELIHRTAIYAPPPYKKVDEDGGVAQPDRLRAAALGAARRRHLHHLLLRHPQRLRQLRLAVRRVVRPRRGRDVGAKTMQSLEEDPNGPQVDLRKELIEHLGQRVSMLTDYQLPITTTSERLLFAIEVKDPKAVAKAMEKLFKNDPTVKPPRGQRA